MNENGWPIPEHFDPDKAGEIWRVPYAERAAEALSWRREHAITPAASDARRVELLIVDAQNTFCIPGFELFVAGRSGRAAVSDNERLCRFIYGNLGHITRIRASMDTHTAMQIFHPIFLVDERGQHPKPMTVVSVADVEAGRWRVNPDVAPALEIELEALQRHLLHYCRSLSRSGQYELMIWPYHSMLGGVGHALVASVEEALFFHNVARHSQTRFEIKGGNPRTENYSVLCPEVLVGEHGEPIAKKNEALIEALLDVDALIIAGQAKSHCMSWTISSLLAEIRLRDAELAKKVFLLEDCTSSVVVPGVVDFSDAADAAYQAFADAGMHLVSSGVPMHAWPGLEEIWTQGARS